MSAANKLLAGRYQFIQVLGANEAGQTLLVADVHYPGHPKCVLRQLRLPTRNPMTLKFILSLLKKKAEVLETIGQHKQIPSTFASFDADYNFYLVQEFIPGHSLQSELTPGKRMSEPEVLTLLKEVLTVLAFAQEQGVIHGSLRPSKLIRHRTDNRLVVLDFGLIKSVSQEIASRDSTQLPAQISPANRIYSAPEQYKGEARFCSDHYALGMIAIQALTGLPAEELPIAEHLNIHQEIITLLQGIPEIGVNLALLLARMVHPDPDRRYQKAVEVLADLDRLQAPTRSTNAVPVETPVLANDIPTAEVSQVPKNRDLWKRLGLAGLLILALIASIFVVRRVPQQMLVGRQLRRAEAAEKRNEQQTAIEHYTNALQLSPANPQVLARRSQLYFEAKNTDAALADISRAIEQATDEPLYPFIRGNFRRAMGELPEAIADYTSAIEKDPNYAEAFIKRGDTRADSGDNSGAIADYTQAIELDSSSAAHHKALAQRSQLYLQAGDTDAALADITQAIEQAPDNPTYPYTRGNLRYSIGDVQGAIEDHTEAIRNDPAFVKAYVNRGSARADWGDNQGAIEDYTQAIELDPPAETKAAAYLNRCFSYSNLDEQRLALEDCSAAINLRPTHSLAYQNRGLVRRRLGDLQGALQDYNIAIQIEPDSPDAYYNRGLARKDLDDLSGALADFTKAIAVAPDYVFAFYDRGLVHLEIENRAEALADFEKASDLCIDLGRTECYEDAQYQISQIEGAQAGE